MNRRVLVFSLMTLIGIGVGTMQVLAEDLPKGAVEVGTTKDCCNKANLVVFTGAGGKEIEIKANETKTFELQDVTKEVFWYCKEPGGKKTRERSANDGQFNWLKIERSGTGAFVVTFYRVK
jgi:hypothetical protein